MQFNTIEFFLFFLISIIIYYFTSDKAKKWQLLCYSLIFYSFFSIGELSFLIILGLISWVGEQIIAKYRNRYLLSLFIVLILSPLILIKYFNLFPGAILPVGISFFTLQAVSGVVDTYQKKIRSINLRDHLTYLSFFPTVVSGPIIRKGSFLKELDYPKIFQYEEVRRGFYRIALGYIEKFFLADRIGKLVNYVYTTPGEASGIQIVVGTVLFGWQLYYDFAGYSHMCIGFSKCFGITIIENFERPYLAASIKEFWARWHRSLSSWLRDYVYIPLGGNRKGELYMYRNLIITFMISGIWHGVGLNFFFWGFLHGIYQIVEDICQKKKKERYLCDKKGGKMIRGIKTLFVFLLVDFAWLFFRASDLRTALIMIGRIITDFNFTTLFSDWWFNYGMSKLEYLMLLVVILVIMILDFLEEKKYSVRMVIEKQKTAVRWFFYMVILFFMVITFMIGVGNNAGTFLYQNF